MARKRTDWKFTEARKRSLRKAQRIHVVYVNAGRLALAGKRKK